VCWHEKPNCGDVFRTHSSRVHRISTGISEQSKFGSKPSAGQVPLLWQNSWISQSPFFGLHSRPFKTIFELFESVSVHAPAVRETLTDLSVVQERGMVVEEGAGSEKVQMCKSLVFSVIPDAQTLESGGGRARVAGAPLFLILTSQLI
jgi:hypothetical protein